MDSREDHDLVAACRNRRRDAYGILVQRHWQRMLGVCLAVLGNPDDAEDAAQEAMLKGLEQIGKLRDAQQFGPWIVRIARNLSIDVCRKKKRRRDHLRQQHPPSPAKASDHHDLETAIGALPLELRIPLVMYISTAAVPRISATRWRSPMPPCASASAAPGRNSTDS